MYSLVTKSLEWEQELYSQFKYTVARPYFHTFAADTYNAGLNFANVDEAGNFAIEIEKKLQEWEQKLEERRKRFSRHYPKPPSAAGSLNREIGKRSSLHESRERQERFSGHYEKPPSSAAVGSLNKEIGKTHSLTSRGKKKITKDDIGPPMNFRHVGHIGWDPQGGFDAKNIQMDGDFGIENVAQEKDLERTVPAEILARGPLALESYNKALMEGKTCVKRLPVMMIGQERTGKTSLKKSLKGEVFNAKEGSTDGIEVDPSQFKVTAEIWKTGEKNKETDSESEISFECRAAAQLIFKSLKEEENSMNVSESFVVEHDITFDPESEEPSQNTTESLVADNKRTDQPPEEPNRGGSESLFADHSFAASEHLEETITDSGTDSGTDSPTKLVSIETAVECKKEDYSHLFVPQLPEDIATLVEKLLEEDEKKEDEEIYSVLWDFGGQSVYYSTHPIFLSPKALYILVCDLSRDPHARADPLVRRGMFKNKEDICCNKTNLDYLDFWLSSVYSLTSPDDTCQETAMPEILPTRLPPVFFVCTHADKPYCDTNSRDLALEIYGFLQTKTYREHLVKDVFVVDNTKSGSKHECSEVIRLRDEILAVAKELPQMKEEIPLKWLRYETALQLLCKEHYKWIPLADARQLALDVCRIDDEFEFHTLLNFLHDQRILIHFNGTTELERMVILDPQWLIDVFKMVITVKRYEHKDRKVQELWRKLEKTGILDENLLEHVWSSLFDKRETRKSLTAIMERFSLLCSWPSNSESNKQYLVPSMLLSPPTDAILKLIAAVEIPSLYVKFTSGRVPPGLFCRLVLQFFQWCNEECKSEMMPQLFQNFAMFHIRPEQGTSVVFLCHSSSIEVSIHSGNKDLEVTADVNNGRFDVTTSRNIYAKLRMMLECMRKEFSWLENMSYEMCVTCLVCSPSGKVNYCDTHDTPGCSQDECLHFVSDSELHECRQFFICTRPGVQGDCRIQVRQYARHWFGFLDVNQELSSTSSPASSAQSGTLNLPNERLKVTLLSSEWSSSKGGLSTINREIAVLLAKHPHVEVTLLVPQFSCSEEDKKAARSRNITILEAEKRPGFEDPLDWLISPPKKHVIDVIVGHGAKLGKQAQFIRETHSSKWVQVVHTAPEELSLHKGYAKAISKGEGKNEAEIDLCKLANLVMAVGPKLAKIYSSYLRSCKKDILQLTPGVFSEFSVVKQAPEEGGMFKVLTFGRGDPEDFSLKGYDIAAKAIVELKDNSYCLIFVGAPDGKQEDVVQQLLQYGICKKQLVVRTFVQSKDKLKDLLCEVDLAIMPSRTEGFGLTALEALSAGLPILVSGNSGFGEALQTIPCGRSFVVDSEDCKEWAKAITVVRQKNRAQRLQEIQTLRACYGDKYSWEKQGGVLIDKMWHMVHGRRLLPVTQGLYVSSSQQAANGGDEGSLFTDEVHRKETGEEEAFALPCAVQEALLSQSWDDSRDVMVRPQEDLQLKQASLENPEASEEQALVLPSAVEAALLSESSDAKDVVARLQEDLQLKQVSLKNPEPETKKMIRCLARKAKYSCRLDVVKHLREVTPAGTTGPLLHEDLDVQYIPLQQSRDLSVHLCGGDEWMMVAERLGLTQARIRFLERRSRNPFEDAVVYIRSQQYLNVGQLYDVMVDCGFPTFADLL
ncbi:uncharacterized protein LOC144660144 isoform X2 [Oculina patagonica]